MNAANKYKSLSFRFQQTDGDQRGDTKEELTHIYKSVV